MDRQATALEAGLNLLGFRPHSRLELERKLARRGHEPDDVEAAIGRLLELGYLDDAAYARAVVSERSARRGTRAIAAELRARGVGREAAETALAELDDGAQRAAASRLARRLLKQPGGRAEQQRAAAALARRGFSFEVAWAAVAEAAGGGPDGDE